MEEEGGIVVVVAVAVMCAEEPRLDSLEKCADRTAYLLLVTKSFNLPFPQYPEKCVDGSNLSSTFFFFLYGVIVVRLSETRSIVKPTR